MKKLFKNLLVTMLLSVLMLSSVGTAFAEVDSTPPTVSRVWTDKEVYYIGDTPIVYVEAYDDLSGVKSINVEFKAPSGIYSHGIHVGYDNLEPYESPNDSDSSYYKLEVTDFVPINQYRESGKYILDHIYITDSAGNYVSYGRNSNSPLPIYDEFLVKVDGNAVELPDLTIENFEINRLSTLKNKINIQFDVVNLGQHTNNTFLVDIANHFTTGSIYLNNYDFTSPNIFTNRIHIDRDFEIGEGNLPFGFGDNRIVVRVNPDSLVTESNYDNNKIEKIVSFYENESYKPAYVENLIIPKTVKANTSFAVTIAGHLASGQYEVANVEVEYSAYKNRCMAIGKCVSSNTIKLKPKVKKRSEDMFYTQATVPYKKEVKIRPLKEGVYIIQVIGSNKTIEEKFEVIKSSEPIVGMPSPVKKIILKGILKKDSESTTDWSLINLNGQALAHPSLEECTSNLDIYKNCGDIDFSDYADKGVKIHGYVKRVQDIRELEINNPTSLRVGIGDDQEIKIYRSGKDVKKFIKNSYRTVKKVYVESIDLIETNESLEITVEDEVALDITPYVDVKKHWAEDHVRFLKNNKIISQTNENFNPEKYITVAEASKIVAGVADLIDSTDLSTDSNWQNTVMDKLKESGIVDTNEFQDDSYTKPILRKEFVKMIIKALEIEVEDVLISSFSDVKNDSYKKYIVKASELGIVNGYGDGRFGPDNYIRRSELAKVIHNTLKSLGL